MNCLNIYINSKAHNILTKDISGSFINHAYLLVGNDIELLNGISVYMANQILCNNLCGNCNDCIKIKSNSHTDVKIINNSKNNIVSVEEINNIISDCYVAPLENDYKIYIITNYDLLRTDVQNKLLKTLEEPPKNVIFILTTVCINGILGTIKSRCKKIYEPKISNELFLQFLNDNNIKNSSIISSISDSNISTALKLSKDTKLIELINLIIDIFINLKESSDVCFYSGKLSKYSDNLSDIFNFSINIINSAKTFEIVENNNFENEKLKIINKLYTYEMIKIIIYNSQNAIEKIKWNCNTNAIIDCWLFGILEAKYKCKKQ